MSADGGKVSGRDVFEAADGRNFILAEDMVLRVEHVVAAVAVHGHFIGEGDRLHAGNRGELVEDFLLLVNDSVGLRIGNLGFGNVEAEGLQRVGRGEAGVDLHERLEGADHEAGADEQHQSEGHLDDDESFAGAVALAALRECAAAFAQAARGFYAGIFEDGNCADEHAGEKGQSEGEEQHGNVDADFMNAGQAGGCGGDEGAQSARGKAEADEAADDSDNQAFKKQFTGSSPPGCSEGGANGEFLTAAFHADEKKIGDVGAGDEQNHGNGAHQHPQHLAHVAHNVLLQWAEVGADMGFIKQGGAEAVWRRKAAKGNGQQPCHVCAGLLHRHAGFEAGERFETEVAEFGFAAVPLHGHVDGGIGIIEEMKIPRQHADDLAGSAIDGNGRADDGGRTAVLLLPIGVGEKHGFRRSGGVVLAAENAAEGGRYAEQRKRAVGDIEAAEMLRLACAGNVD